MIYIIDDASFSLGLIRDNKVIVSETMYRELCKSEIILEQSSYKLICL